MTAVGAFQCCCLRSGALCSALMAAPTADLSALHLMCRKWPQEFQYTVDAPKGHLPLTNCLRGTQLFKAILEHPAFERPGQGEQSSAKPEWLKDTETKISL